MAGGVGSRGSPKFGVRAAVTGLVLLSVVCSASKHEARPLGDELAEDAEGFFNEVMDTLDGVVSGDAEARAADPVWRPSPSLRRGQRRADGGATTTGLPKGWKQYTDALTSQPYYYNEEQGVSSPPFPCFVGNDDQDFLLCCDPRTWTCEGIMRSDGHPPLPQWSRIMRSDGHPPLPQWSIPQPDLVGSLPVCTSGMIKTSYTRCDYSTLTRSLDYFYLRPCKKGVPLPPTVNDLPCNTTCSKGEFLPLGAAVCSKCDAGKYSIGGGYKFSNWEAMPDGMTTFCRFQLDSDSDSDTPCTGWVLNGTYIFSGDMRGRRLMDSVLQYKVDFFRAGSVEFEFKVDAERRWDGIFFTVDGEMVMEMQSYNFNYEKFSHPISPGFHTLEWIYHKDVAYEMGEDTAWLQSIQVIGTLDNAARCNVCPKGEYSGPGAETCTLCPMNTFSDKSGSSNCKACPANKFAYPGSDKCENAKPCKKTDMMMDYTKCSNKKRTRTYSFIEPKICHGGEELPAPKEIDCAPCFPGTYRAGSDCVNCPDGKYNPNATFEGESVCKACADGTIAKKIKYFDTLFVKDSFDDYLQKDIIGTGCANGFCGTGGWRPVGDALDTGVGNGAVADIWLSLKVELETFGEVTFTFDRQTANEANSLQMYIDEDHIWDVETAQAWNDEGGPITWTTEMQAGTHIITWVYHKEREYSWMEDADSEDSEYEYEAKRPVPESGVDRVTISSIMVSGIADGGAVQCLPCPGGYIANPKSSMCDACRPGTFTSAANPGKCTPCPEGQFASSWASTECQRCGHGTFSKEGSAECDVSPSQCKYQVSDGTAYDLSDLARVGEPMWGPIVDGENSVAYYINICSKDHSNSTCQGRDGVAVTAYACQQNQLVDDVFNDNALTVSLGDTMAFYTLESDPKNGLIVSFQGGTPCSNGAKRSMNVTMICDQKVGPGVPALPEGGTETEKCGYQLEWRSQYACPVCTEGDMESFPGECSVTGHRPVNMVWKEPRKCHGGLQLPGVRYEECVAVMLDKSKIAMIVVGAIVILVVLVGALLVMYLRNRKIYQEYSVLKEQNEADMELERYTLDDEE